MSRPQTINDILAQIGNDLPSNNEGLITAEILRNVLTPLVMGVYDSLAAPNDVVLAQFPLYNNKTIYTGGEEVIVRYNDQLWLFVSTTDKEGVDPGTNPLVWNQFSLLALAHSQNKDTHLSLGQPHGVSALELREHIDDESIHGGGGNSIEFDLTIPKPLLLGSFDNPVEIIPAPGEDQVIVDVDMYFYVIGNTENYTEPALLEWSSGLQYPTDTNYSLNPGVSPIVRIDHDSESHEINSAIVLKSSARQSAGNHTVRVFGRYSIKNLAV